MTILSARLVVMAVLRLYGYGEEEQKGSYGNDFFHH
jgi:hypothetical protein